MFEHRSLRWPITLGVLMFVILAALLAGWIVLNVFGLRDAKWAPLYITLLTTGTVFLTLAIVGTALYLTLAIKAINLSRRQSNFIDSVTHVANQLAVAVAGEGPGDKIDFVRWWVGRAK